MSKLLKKIRVLFFLFTTLFVIASVYAQDSDFDLSVKPIKSTIFEDEVGEYNLTITNYADFEESFLSPYTSDTGWIITTDPQLFKIAPNTTQSYKIYVDPRTDVIPGQYGVTLNIRSSISNEITKGMFLIFIKPLNPLPQGYLSSIALNVEAPTQMDPRKEVIIEVYLRNRNAKEFKNLTIDIKSNLLNKKYSIPLNPVEERTERFSFQLYPYTLPQDDKITVTIYEGRDAINQVSVPVRVIPYTEIKEQRKVVEKFLKTQTTITITNFGNIENTNPYKYPEGFFESFVTFTVPGNTFVTKEDKRYLNFPVSLGPGDSTDISVTKNYRFVVYSIIIIVLLIVSYFQLRSPVTVKKEAIAHQPTHDGVSEFKVKVLVKNRSQKPVENVKVIEAIPSLALLVREVSVGTVEPTKIIRNDKRGTLIRWDINYLEPFEERIITYRIKSKLNIIGGLTLEPTKAKFETVNGRERVTYSKKHRVKIYA